MSIQTHVESLNKKHAEIEDVISREELRPQPDGIRLKRLKKEKLLLKEELHRLCVKH